MQNWIEQDLDAVIAWGMVEVWLAVREGMGICDHLSDVDCYTEQL